MCSVGICNGRKDVTLLHCRLKVLLEFFYARVPQVDLYECLSGQSGDWVQINAAKVIVLAYCMCLDVFQV